MICKQTIIDRPLLIALLIFFIGFLAVVYSKGTVLGMSSMSQGNNALLGGSDYLGAEISEEQELIRFHVIANSDQEEDQALKRAVRDAILRKVSPILALSKSIEESRQMLLDLRPQMEETARQVVADWGHSDAIASDYGVFQFPTKSYGSLVLPAGEYEAVRILIGKAEGSNWWCVLFPPLCFIDVDQAVAVPVDGKPSNPEGQTSDSENSEQKSPKVKFYFWEKVKQMGKG